MKSILVFDIETIPDIDGLRKLNSFDSSLSDDQLLDLVKQDRIKKSGHDFLPLHLHRIISISCLFRNNDVISIKTLGKEDDSEQSILLLFFKIINRYIPRLVTWNGSGFDLPVIHYRSLINKVISGKYWDLGEYSREFKFNNYINRYHNRHVDLMDVLSKYNARASVPMDELAKLCDFPGKIGMDGSMVWEAWCSGDIKSIRSYCETDVINTWLLYCRFCLFEGSLNFNSYTKEVSFVKNYISNLEDDHWVKFIASWKDVVE
ncbi:MAG: 3'-5' exonuclease [Candidatus Kinetoplastibacterium crithidii]|nr:3'-5' exonuclease [Candidatus Kinetoplastibacterium crithidii]